MSDVAHPLCPRCGIALRVDESCCPGCLLQAASTESAGAAEEKIFQEALALKPEARAQFIREATRDRPQLESAVLLLIKGCEEAGDDAAQPAHADSPNNREQWAIAANEEPGAVIDHFRLVRLVGEGGMGTVWQAEQTAPIKRTVALKVIKLGMDTRGVVRRFQRERQTLALLSHPGIARVYEAGATALGRPYFAMELVEGQPITAYCHHANLGVRARLALFQEVCAAVEHAHQKGVIHRDLKPSNILVSAGGEVKVIDFGVAKATQDVGDTPFFTRQAQILGTPAYMSPEQARSAGVDIDTRTDVYALGVVLHELLTGAVPIDSARLGTCSIAEMQRIIMEEDPPIPSARAASAASDKKAAPDWRAALRGDLDWIVMKALRKDRDERYASAAALSDDLRRYLAGEPVSAAPSTLAYQVGKFVRRNRASVASGALIVASLVTGLAVSLYQVRQTRMALAAVGQAREETTWILSDMYARSGFEAAEKGDNTRASLWFANAANLAANNPERTAANRLRAKAWRSESMTAVRAFNSGFEHLHQLVWNPHRAAMIVEGVNPGLIQVWDLETEQPWNPAMLTNSPAAAWDPSGERLAILRPDNTWGVLAFPSGKELARLTNAGGESLAWSPDGRWIAGGNSLWNWQTNERQLLPQAASRCRFSRDGKLLLSQWGSLAGVCTVETPGQFLYPPVPASSLGKSDFLGEGQAYVVGHPRGGLVIHDSATGTILESRTNGMSGDFEGLPISVSKDGRFIASLNQGLIDRSTPGEPRISGEMGRSKSASFSPDGSLFAMGGYNNRLLLWSLPDCNFIGEVGHHHTGVVNVRFSPDGKFVASGEDGLVRVWRVNRPNCVTQIAAGFNTLAVVSPDGKLVVPSGIGNRNGNARETQAFDVATRKPAGPKIAPGGLILAATFSRDGKWVALAVSTTPDRSNSTFETNGGSGNIQFWDPLTGRRMGEPIPMPSEPRGLSAHPEGKWVGVCCAGGEALEIKISNHETRLLFSHDKPTDADATLNNGCCSYSPDGRVFAVWGLYQFIHLWDREQRREVLHPFERETTTFDLAFSGSIAARAVVSPSMRIEFLNSLTGGAVATAIPYVNWPFLTRFSDDGKLLLTAGGGKSAQVWDWRQGRLVCPMLPHDDTVMGGCFVPGTPWVITGGHDGKIKFWDRRTGMLIRPPLPLGGWVLDLEVTPDARTLVASGMLGGSIELIDLNQALPDSDLDAENAKLLAEIDADAEIHPGGGLAALTPQAWFKKWREFRERFPRYPGHRLAN